MGPWGPPLSPFLPPFPSIYAHSLSATPSPHQGYSSVLMFLEDKSLGRLWSKWQLHSVGTHMREAVEILKWFQGLSVSQTPGGSVSRSVWVFALCPTVHYLALGLKWLISIIFQQSICFLTFSLYLSPSPCIVPFLPLSLSPSPQPKLLTLWLIWKLHCACPHLSCSVACCCSNNHFGIQKQTDLQLLLQREKEIYSKDLIWDRV